MDGKLHYKHFVDISWKEFNEVDLQHFTRILKGMKDNCIYSYDVDFDGSKLQLLLTDCSTIADFRSPQRILRKKLVELRKNGWEAQCITTTKKRGRVIYSIEVEKFLRENFTETDIVQLVVSQKEHDADLEGIRKLKERIIEKRKEKIKDIFTTVNKDKANILIMKQDYILSYKQYRDQNWQTFSEEEYNFFERVLNFHPNNQLYSVYINFHEEHPAPTIRRFVPISESTPDKELHRQDYTNPNSNWTAENLYKTIKESRETGGVMFLQEKVPFKGFIVFPKGTDPTLTDYLIEKADALNIDIKGWMAFIGFENRVRVVPATIYKLRDFLKYKRLIKKTLKQQKSE